MRKTLERIGLMNTDESDGPADELPSGLPEPLRQDQFEVQPEVQAAKRERPKLPKPSLNPPAGDPTLLPDVVEVIEMPVESALAEEHEFSDDLPPVIDED